MFEKILVPLDGSNLSEQALPLASKLAAKGGSEIILLRGCVPLPVEAPVAAGEQEQVPAYSPAEARREARDYLEKIKAACRRPGVTVRSLLLEGEAAGLIVDTAVAEAIDLIVMSSHGWSGRSLWSLGGITERVLNSTACPVLVVRSQEPISHVLIALDGSEVAEQSLAPGLAVARRLGASVTLFRANEPVVVDRPPTFIFGWEQTEAGQRWQSMAHEEATLYLEDVRQDIENEAIEVHTVVLNGPTVETILEYTADYQEPLIVMTTHGRSGLRRWLYGSVTAKVLRSTNCCLLVVRTSTEKLN